MYESNEIIEKLPVHLLDLIIEQPYNEYTAQDHAVWRYVMRQNVRYLSKVAHGSYLDGLRRTGISIDEIPHMYGMNRILKEIGWAAVAVDGFIPPSAFMEFQAYNVLVIAADIRPIDQIEYTPAPDIIHEAAGHAPIIADENYASYLKYFGEIGSKAIPSKNDNRLYEAIRHLSILKADPYSTKENIEQAEKELDEIAGNMGGLSEMAQIRNLHWWTVEYGLIGDLRNFKIYGAGLLSSIGESYSCMQPDVKKIPYTIAAKDVVFDITTRQPQLFVTPDFNHLTKVLEEFTEGMALRQGGLSGLKKAYEAGSVTTYIYSSGLQVSGIVSDVIDREGKPIYVFNKGKTILCTDNKVIEGQGTDRHPDGFGSPVGKLKACHIPLENMNKDELKKRDILENHYTVLEFESGVVVRGMLRKILTYKGKNIIFTFDECMVTFEDRILFQPQWGIYDMAVGEKIVSVYAGVSDPVAYGLHFQPPAEKTHKIVHDERARALHQLYQQVRDLRKTNENLSGQISLIWEKLKKEYPDEWLLILELFEILIDRNINGNLRQGIEYQLNRLKRNPQFQKLIINGMEQIYAGMPAC